MRDIRFAWVCRNKTLNTIERVELTDSMLLSRAFPSWIITDNCEVLAKILPTGFPDKNDKEIYEGDIVGAFYFVQDKLPVSFSEGAFRVDNGQDGKQGQLLSDYIRNYPGKVERIGNIWENK